MTVWPFIPVWPLLVTAAVLAAPWNARAAALFVAVVVLSQAINHFELRQPTIARMMLYSVAAVVAFAWVDRTAAAFIALIGVMIAMASAGLVPTRAQVVAAEVIIVAGVLCCAWVGPGGGLLERDRAGGGVDGRSVHSAFRGSEGCSQTASTLGAHRQEVGAAARWGRDGR